jgi:hypothetical protein
MSIIKLNSIIVNRSYNEDNPDFYVGAVIPAKSGYLTPKLVTSKTELNSIFGDFKFKGMYEMLIENEIPICLLPQLTEESKYNRCSLRLSSNSEIPVCYPRYGKDYDLKSKSNTTYVDFIDANTVELPYDTEFFPLVSLSVLITKDDGSQVLTEVLSDIYYIPNNTGTGGIIKVDFGDKKYTGTLMYESIPDLDKDLQYYHIKSDVSSSGVYRIDKSDKNYIPEVVVSQKVNIDGKVGYKLVSSTVDTIFNDDNTLYVEFGNVSDDFYRVDVRYIKENLITIGNGNKQVSNNGDKHPIVKFTYNDGSRTAISLASLTYSNNTTNINYKNNISYQYNTITSDSVTDYDVIVKGIKTYNFILDFSDAITDGKLNEGYFILDTHNSIVLIKSSEIQSPPSQLYTRGSEIQWGSDNPAYTAINNIKSGLKKYVRDVRDLESILTNYIERFCNKHKEELKYPQYFGNDIRSELINESYANEFYLLDRNDITKILSTSLDRISNINLSYDSIIYSIRDALNILKLEGKYPYKLLVDFEEASTDQHVNEVKGFKYYSNWNINQDRLCEYTENKKVIDVYSKIKGPTGSNITLDITSDTNYKGLYNLHITNGYIVEDYTVYLINKNYINIDAIYIGDVGLKSKLVDIIVYDYLLNNKYIDSHHFDFNENGYKWSESNIRSESEMILTPGTYQLKRNSDECYTYDDLIKSYDIYKSSNWYPDLFLVDEVPDNLNYFDDLLDLIDYNSDPDKSIFSQALICLKYYQLGVNWNGGSLSKVYKNKNNRLLYFYDTMQIDGVEVPSYYPYILNILGMDPIGIPNVNCYYDPISFKVNSGLYLGVDKIPNYFIKVLSISNINEQFKLGNKIVTAKYYCKFEFKYVRSTIGNEYSDNGYLIGSCTFNAYLDDNKHILYKEVTSNGDISNNKLLFHNINILESSEYYILKRTDEGILYREYHKFDPKSVLIDSITNSYPNTLPQLYDLKDILVDLKVNFLYYDNLRYYYYNIIESGNQPSVFLIRFIASKYTRLIYFNKGNLIGRSEYDVHLLLNEINNKCISLIPFIKSSEFTYTYNENSINVVYNVTIVDLVNKEYKLNIILNI